MQSAANTIPLTRRLVGQYLVFGLGCLFLSIGTSLALSYRQQLDVYVWCVVLVTVLFLVAGAFAVFATSRRSSAIERQLESVQSQHGGGVQVLSHLGGNDPVVAGWNRLIETLGEQATWKGIENQLAQTADKAEESQAEQIFQKLPIAVAFVDEDGTIQQCNTAFEGLLETEAATDVLGESIESALRFPAAKNGEELVQRFSEHVGATTFDLLRGDQLEDGVLRITRSPFVVENEVVQHLWVIRDVTQQLLAEEMRTQFVSTATHELRTPLSNIKSYAEMLGTESGVSVEKQKDFCNIINAEATRLLRFVDELLSINQMEVGSLSATRHQTDLEAVVNSVLEHVRPECQRKKITLDTKLPAKWPKLVLDKDKIESALVNLIGNAAKYTPDEGRVAVEVEVSDNAVSIHVEDTGIGISEEELPRVFDKFYRSEDERVRELTGNGLGLSFASEVARMHGGRLNVHSELNKGSRFTLELPKY